MKLGMRDLVYLVLLIAAGLGGYYYGLNSATKNLQAPLSASPKEGSAAATDSDEGKIQYPVADEKESSPSSLDSKTPVTDSNFETALSSLFGSEAFETLFNAGDIAHKIVVTVDSLTGSAQPKDSFLPLKSPDSDFATLVQENKTVIDPANFTRYQPYVQLLERVDLAQLVRVYRHFYPLLQAAYKELGSKKYFNDRLIAVIDNILKTPDVVEPIEVTHSTPNGKYSFVDKKLENSTPAQKILLRMGLENAKIIKTKLREIRNLLTQA